MRIKPYTTSITPIIGTTYTCQAENFSFITVNVSVTLDSSGPEKDGRLELQVNHGSGFITVGSVYLRLDPFTEPIEIEIRGQLSGFVPTGSTWKLVEVSDVLVDVIVVEATETKF